MEVAETPKMGSTYDCNLSKDLIDDTNLASPSAEEESGRNSTGPVATRDLPSITKTEWLEFCVDLVRAFEDYRGWKLLWYISNKDLKLKQLEDEYQQTKTGIRALRTQLRLFNEQLKYVPRCTTENFDARRYSGVDSVPSELEDVRAEIGRLEKLTHGLKIKTTYSLDLSNATWKTDSRIKQYVKEQVYKTEIASINFMHPLVKIGTAVRNRFLELCSTRNKDIIILGNEAAHYGNPVADALLYHPNNAKKRQDQATFVSIYGHKLQTIWMLRDCTPFIEMVSWYGSIKSWYPKSFEGRDFTYRGQRTSSSNMEERHSKQFKRISKLRNTSFCSRISRLNTSQRQ
jgi:hypothetical protein